ncbi:MAG TPA: response regulator [Phycisphaerae bacterium]|nr:response regulator [Phycisphaerae bacterium]HOB75184.1 response regulator [Phycisphaerae bacterium]HOJ54665.1 response regulator [Phycisphaerae bacterium]HOL25985.1 response regulator [Phycisphaerae bacterium]HPP19443.1 response regulator [Phycisphaerae bacterium]
MEKYGDILTTGEVAKICKVAPRTVSKWFDTGQLRGYRIPGSKDRRIPRQQLVRFMKAHGMPLDEIETGQTRILIADPETELTGLIQQALMAGGQYEVRTTESAFEAGAITETFQPHVLLVDLDLPGIDGRTLARFFAGRAELKGTQIIGMSAALTDPDRQALLQQGFHYLIAKPFHIRELADLIQRALDTPRSG